MAFYILFVLISICLRIISSVGRTNHLQQMITRSTFLPYNYQPHKAANAHTHISRRLIISSMEKLKIQLFSVKYFLYVIIIIYGVTFKQGVDMTQYVYIKA